MHLSLPFPLDITETQEHFTVGEGLLSSLIYTIHSVLSSLFL